MHTPKDKAKLIARVRRIKGQADALERAREAELGCSDVLMLAASLKGAANGITSEIMADHIRHHIVDPDKYPNSLQAKGAVLVFENGVPPRFRVRFERMAKPEHLTLETIRPNGATQIVRMVDWGGYLD